MYDNDDITTEVDPRNTPVRNRALGRKQRGNRTNIRHRAIRASRLGR